MEEITAAQTWNELAGDAALERTVQALQANGITAVVAATKDEARQRVVELVPEGAQVFTAQSATLNEIGVAAEINQSGRYESLRKKLMTRDRMTQRAEMRRLTAAPDYVIGSVNAITENGHLISASFGGSQLGPYASSAGKVIWVAGTNKIVKDFEEGLRRIEERALPLEDERLMRQVGRHSGIGKILIVRLEAMPGRSTLVLVKEALGF